MHPVVLKGHIWYQKRLVRGAVGLDPGTGRITAVARALQGETEVDHGADWILPGGIDPHVHLRDPGHPAKEDFESGTRSALLGGTTTLLDMPNTDPPTTDVDAYRAKVQIATRRAVTDWGLYGGATRPGPALQALAKEAPGIKLYLGESTGCVTLEDPDLLPEVLQDLDAAGFTGVLVFHAEAKEVLQRAGAAEADTPGLRGHAARRPADAETVALEQIDAALEGRHPAYKIHIAHVSTPRNVAWVRERGWSFGVTPNHLYLHHDMPLGAHGRLNPPLRRPADQAGLFTALAKGHIPIIESDHAPHTVAEKERDVLEAPSGIPGVGTLRPLLLRSVVERQLPLVAVLDATAENPADLFGLPKGRLEPGCDADLAIYHPGKRTRIDPSRLESRAGWSPFADHDGIFPTQVYLRGVQVVRDGTVIAPPGTGRQIERGRPEAQG